MRITVESIDQRGERRLGCMQLPSFPVQFSSATFSGKARFVPAGSDWQRSIGQTFEVEINQENITNFEVLEASVLQETSVTAQTQPGDFRVCGVVIAIVSIAEPDGEQIITVKAGDALFNLTRTELRIAHLSEGSAVAFTVHDMSLWDEAI